VVYRAYDARLKCDVAVKFIRRGQIPTDHLDIVLKRFEREAKRMAKFNHPNIVPVIEYGEHEGNPYLVMPFFPTGTLKTKTGKPIPYQEAARFLIPLAHALAYAHKQGTIHRDVKPANILLTDTGQPMLTDFGIAKVLDLEEGQTLTGTGIIVGTPKYMAPEQWKNRVSPQTDIYALGIVFYELVTGRVPFDSETPAGILEKQLTESLPPPRQFAPNLPIEAEQVIFKALARKPEDRYSDMSAFAVALEKLVVGTMQKNVISEAETAFQESSLPEQIISPRQSELEKISLPSKPYVMERSSRVIHDGSNKEIDSQTAASPPLPTQPKSRQTGFLWLLVVPIGITILIVFFIIQPKQMALVPTSVVMEKQAVVTVTSIPVLRPTEEQSVKPLNLAVTALPSPALTVTTPPSPTLIAIIPLSPTLAATTSTSPTLTLKAPMTPTQHPSFESASGATQISSKDSMVSVYVPAGVFLMGSAATDKDAADDEKPQHKITLEGYWIDKTEVTNVMYKKCVDSGSCGKPGCSHYGDSQYDDHPVVCVDWSLANAYCKWVGGRLPTEAEWEKAARGTDGRIYPWGNDPPSNELFNYDNNIRGTTVVGNFPKGASPYGLLDMAGNVWEWVNDWYGEMYYWNSPRSKPQGPSYGRTRVMRGGSWDYRSWFARSASRSGVNPVISSDNHGFRCVRLP
jgi:formylglycine-generating enzyme required for sulfatase activity